MSLFCVNSSYDSTQISDADSGREAFALSSGQSHACGQNTTTLGLGGEAE